MSPEAGLQAHLQHLEELLLSVAIRSDRVAVASLLAADFREFGSSGRVYDRQQILELLHSETPAVITLSDFSTKLLAEHVALVTYRSVRTLPGGDPEINPVAALRSSVWHYDGANWTMVFHQGTPLPVERL